MAKQYLDKDGVQQVWNAVDSKFMRSSGTATRPTYNGNDLALYSDIPRTAKNLYMHTTILFNATIPICILVYTINSTSSGYASLSDLHDHLHFGDLRKVGDAYEGFSYYGGSWLDDRYIYAITAPLDISTDAWNGVITFASFKYDGTGGYTGAAMTYAGDRVSPIQ